MKISVPCLIQHGATDGLSAVQRATLRYLAGKTCVNASTASKELLAAAGCPRGLTPEFIDAVILTMSHPMLCRRPLLTYVGGFEDLDGWAQGPCYRGVELTAEMRLILPRTVASETWWSPTPIDLEIPFALVNGCWSWVLETDEAWEPAREQAPRRVRCVRIHLFGASPHHARDAMRTSDWIDAYGTSAASTLVPDRRRPSSSHAALLNNDAKSEGERRVMLANRPEWLPHGRLVGLDSTPTEDALGCALCIPCLERLLMNDDPGAAWHLLTEPACGRHMLQEIELLESLPNVTVQRIEDDGRRTRRHQAVAVRVEGELDMAVLVARVPISPLEKDVVRDMLRLD